MSNYIPPSLAQLKGENLEFLTGKSLEWLRENFTKLETLEGMVLRQDDILISTSSMRDYNGFFTSAAIRELADNPNAMLYVFTSTRLSGPGGDYTYDIYDATIDNDINFIWQARSIGDYSLVPQFFGRHSGYQLERTCQNGDLYIYTGKRGEVYFMNWNDENPLEVKE